MGDAVCHPFNLVTVVASRAYGRRMKSIIVAAACLLTLTGCGWASKPKPAAASVTQPAAASPSISASPVGDPQTYEGAKAALARFDEATAKRDYKTLWGMLTAFGQSAMSESDFAYVAGHCKAITGDKNISFTLNDANTIATVTAAPGDGGDTYTWNLVYENGYWKHQPSTGAMQWMSLSRGKALAYLNSYGC